MLQRLVLLNQPIWLYLEDSMSEQDRASYDLSDAEWAMVKSVLSLLEAVDGVTTALSGEKYSTLSWCLPLLFGLRDAAKCDENDCMILVGIKKLTNQLNERFHLDELEMDSPPVLAAALDPRFRKLSLLSNSEHSEVHEILVEKASSGDCSCSDTSDMPPIKKKKLSALDHLLGEDVDKDKSSNVTEKVALYLQEHPIKRSEDPFAWWHSNASRFPHLAVVARRYLAIPATSTPSEGCSLLLGLWLTSAAVP